jgi:hypothetical protein
MRWKLVPNTAEWIELYNTCTNPVDLSCFVINRW